MLKKLPYYRLSPDFALPEASNNSTTAADSGSRADNPGASYLSGRQTGVQGHKPTSPGPAAADGHRFSNSQDLQNRASAG